nr:MAG TPA: hypothetical protein [Inoviridae sp.]
MGEVSVACNLRNLLRSVRVSRAQPVSRPKYSGDRMELTRVNFSGQARVSRV